MPLDPVLLGRQAGLAARARRGGRPGARRRHAAHGHGRLVPLRPARRRVRHRPGHRLADAARRAGVRPGAAGDLRRAGRGAAGDRGHGRRPRRARHDSWPVELPLRARCPDQQAALAGAGCVEPGLAKATYGTGVFLLAHAGDERPRPSGGLLPDGRLADRRPRRVGARRRRVHRRGPAGVAEPRPRLADDPAALAAAAAAGRRRGRRAGAAGAGGHWRPVVATGRPRGDRRRHLGTRPGHVARAALEAIAWRVADVLVAVRESVPVEVLRVDGGLTRSELLLSMQADAAGVACSRGGRRHGRGSRRPGCRGGGVLGVDPRDRRAHPHGNRVEPGRDAPWREREHAAWRQFVERATEL